MIYYKVDWDFKITGLCSFLDRRFDSSFEFIGESHNFWELFAVLEGEVEVVEDERTYRMHSGDIICHAPGEFHRLKSAGQTSPRSFTICFLHEGTLPDKLAEGVFHMPRELIDELAKAKAAGVEAIGEEFDGGYNYYTLAELKLPQNKRVAGMEAVARLTSFLISLSKLEPSEKRLSRTAGAMEYRKIVRTMTERVRDNLSLKDIAELHHISDSYIKKLFRSYAGEGPTAYYTRLRIQEACHLLNEGLSISEISEMMNFSSAAYFSAFFKRQMGECAKEYKKKC